MTVKRDEGMAEWANSTSSVACDASWEALCLGPPVLISSRLPTHPFGWYLARVAGKETPERGREKSSIFTFFNCSSYSLCAFFI